MLLMQQEGAQQTAGHLWPSQWQHQQAAAGDSGKEKLISVYLLLVMLTETNAAIKKA